MSNDVEGSDEDRVFEGASAVSGGERKVWTKESAKGGAEKTVGMAVR